MGSRVAFCLVLLNLVACHKTDVDPLEGLPGLEGLKLDPARQPAPPAEPPLTVSVSHLLCSYQGAHGALRKIKRNREQARQRAQHLLKLARAQEHGFANLARRFSDDIKNARDGGDLGLTSRGELHPALEKTAFGLGLGQVSDVVETPKGFHILHRHPPNHAQAIEILVSYTGAKDRTPRTPRTREQARILAGQILERLKQGAPVGPEALAHSDHPTYPFGGSIPIFKKGTKHPKFEEIVFGLKVGQLSDVVETPTGFHIVKRLPGLKIQVRHVLIKFRNPDEAPGKQPKEPLRSYPEASDLIEQIHREAHAPGTDFADLASRLSEGPERRKGGLMDPFARGKLPYSFETAAFGLKVMEISNIVETDAGFHVIKRVR